MYKYVLTSFIALVASNAYGSFDFTNYTPTLGTNSAYTITFTQVANNSAPNTITTYSVDTNDYSITPFYYTYSVVHGGATNNRLIVNSGTSQNITESFILQTSNYRGGAICNSGFSIDSITGDFIGNSATSAAGAVYNAPGASISSVIGDFIDNHASAGGAIMNYDSEIGSITGNFIGNYSGQGGAITNGNDDTIGSITGNFIGNYGTSSTGGGAINNYGVINHITGDFIGNNSAYGGALYNEGTMTDITGNFIGNYTSTTGGAINNREDIGDIFGNFIGNYSTSYGGAIHSWNATISSITGNFIGNHGLSGGAIYNRGDAVLGTIRGNFFNNYSEQYGGAVYTDSDITFLSDSANYIISGNYTLRDGRQDIAITVGDDYDVSKDIFITFENNKSTHYIVDDEIENDARYANSYSISVTGDGTGYTQFNNGLHNVNTVNINNGTMIFGQTPDNYTGVANIGHFIGVNNPIMNLENGTFNIANGYTETITLTGLNSVGNNNFIVLDLDVANNSADFITVTDNISGQINLVIQSLSDLDIGDNIIWFADVNTDDAGLFNLYSVSGLDYELGLYFDEDNHKYGLLRLGNVPVKVLPDNMAQRANHIAETLVYTVKNLTSSMQKRVDNLQWLSTTDAENQSGINNAFWMRNTYKGFDVNKSSMALSGVEFGYDGLVSSTDNYKWYVGGLGYISGGGSEFKDTKFDITGYGLGAYVIMLAKSGWFGDLVFRQHFINLEETGIKTDYTASSLNIGTGKEFVFGEDTNELKLFVKPSVTGTYIAISGTDIGAFKVQDISSIMASLSVSAGPRWNFASGRRFQAYGKVGYTMDNSNDVDIIVDGIDTKQAVATNTTELGIGFDYRGINNSADIYLETSYITGTDYSEMSGNIGIRYSF